MSAPHPVWDRVVDAVQIVTAILVAITLTMLFLNSPTPPPQPAAAFEMPTPAPDPAADSETAGGSDAEAAPEPAPTIDVAALYGASCAGCHGGDGSGGIGPPVRSGRMLERYPEAADQIAVVTDGRGGMPAFGDRLTDIEIAAIVEYTRTSLP